VAGKEWKFYFVRYWRFDFCAFSRRVVQTSAPRRNAYRVLLTRARQGMIIFVPKGNANDPTTRPEEFEATARYLVRCGVILLG
jgi:hypothetical protein